MQEALHQALHTYQVISALRLLCEVHTVPSFHMGEHWGSEKVNHLLKITCLVNSEVRILTQAHYSAHLASGMRVKHPGWGWIRCGQGKRGGQGIPSNSAAGVKAKARVETSGLRPRAGRTELGQLLGASLGPVLLELPTQEKPHSQDTHLFRTSYF